MIETFKLTEEDIKNAEHYVTLTDKMAFVRTVAERCFDSLSISANNNGSENALPSCYKVNTDKKSRYLMGAFVGMYLRKPFKSEGDEDKWLMAVDEYDIYAGGHVFEQLNRMKNVAGYRDKCYDIQADYSDLKYRLESDIKGLLVALNDSASRLLAYIEASASPAEMQKALEAMNANQKLLDKFREEHQEEMANGVQ